MNPTDATLSSLSVLEYYRWHPRLSSKHDVTVTLGWHDNICYSVTCRSHNIQVYVFKLLYICFDLLLCETNVYCMKTNVYFFNIYFTDKFKFARNMIAIYRYDYKKIDCSVYTVTYF